jgi:hypothetical protein
MGAPYELWLVLSSAARMIAAANPHPEVAAVVWARLWVDDPGFPVAGQASATPATSFCRVSLASPNRSVVLGS